MHLLDNYSQSFIATNQQRIDTQREQFKVSSVTIANNNKFNITVQNTGQIPINITRIWIQDITTSTSPTRYDVHQSVAPNGVLKNIGQGSAFPIASSADMYSMQLVTGRGNTQQFSVNSVGSAPITIQLIASPPSVTSGFKSQLIMAVTNNQSGTLTNLVPNISLNPGNSATCVADPTVPSSYSTLQSGGTALFTTGVTVSGGIDGQTCTYKAQLTNGYAKNNANATITMNVVNLASTTYAINSGVISDSYTSFGWTQGDHWNNHWQFPSGTTTDFKITIQNNNATVGGYKFWVSKHTQVYLLQTLLPPNSKIVATPFFVVSAMPPNPATPPSLTGLGYSDYSTSLSNGGGTATLYFGASAEGGATQQVTTNMTPGTYFGFVLVYGKFAVNAGDPGSSYAQAIPFLAVVMS